MIQAINAVLLSTQNPQRLIDFYSRLGVKLKTSDHGSGLHAEAEFGAVHFAIWGRATAAPPVEASNVNFSFHVPKLEEAYEELKSKGIVFDSAPTPLPFGGVVANLRDPDGNRITLMRWASDKK
jgi:predicted enzyme related to lactoylglutathione lyase